MKRLIKASNNTSEFMMKDIIILIESLGEDTSLHKYKMEGIMFDDADTYTLTFKCPGNYLACFAMMMHDYPILEQFRFYFKDFDEFRDLVDTYPSEEELAKALSDYWDGDSAKTIYLKNLDTGRYIYKSEKVSI